MNGNELLNKILKRSHTVERRQKRDWVMRCIPLAALVGWMTLIASLIVFEVARPETEDLATRYYERQVISFWNTTLLRTSIILSVAALLIGGVGMLLNSRRLRRIEDSFNKALIALGISSVIVLAVLLIGFSGNL